MSEEAVVDARALEELERIGGPQFVCEMIDIFMRYVPEKMAEARVGLRNGDLDVVRLALHPVRSSACHVGAMTLSASAAQIERLARERNGAAIHALFKEFEEMYGQVEKCLGAKRRALGVPAANDPPPADPAWKACGGDRPA
jgi:HPt (histidine-containing phosphotransfer) domain-containing protein